MLRTKRTIIQQQKDNEDNNTNNSTSDILDEKQLELEREQEQHNRQLEELRQLRETEKQQELQGRNLQHQLQQGQQGGPNTATSANNTNKPTAEAWGRKVSLIQQNHHHFNRTYRGPLHTRRDDLPRSIPDLRLKPVLPPETSEHPTPRLVINLEAWNWPFEPKDKQFKVAKDISTAIDKASKNAAGNNHNNHNNNNNVMIPFAWNSLRFCRKGDLLTHCIVDFATQAIAGSIKTILTSVRYNVSFGLGSVEEKEKGSKASSSSARSVIVVNDFGRLLNDGDGLYLDDLLDIFFPAPSDEKKDNADAADEKEPCSVIPAFDDGVYYIAFHSTSFPKSLFQTPNTSKMLLISILREFGLLLSFAETNEIEDDFEQAENDAAAMMKQNQNNNNNNIFGAFPQIGDENGNDNTEMMDSSLINAGFHNNNNNQSSLSYEEENPFAANVSKNKQQGGLLDDDLLLEQVEGGKNESNRKTDDEDSALVIGGSNMSNNANENHQQQDALAANMMTMYDNTNNNNININNVNNALFPHAAQQISMPPRPAPPRHYTINGVFYFKYRFSHLDEVALHLENLIATNNYSFLAKMMLHPPVFDFNNQYNPLIIEANNAKYPQVLKLLENPEVMCRILAMPHGQPAIRTHWLNTPQLHIGIFNVALKQVYPFLKPKTENEDGSGSNFEENNNNVNNHHFANTMNHVFTTDLMKSWPAKVSISFLLRPVLPVAFTNNEDEIPDHETILFPSSASSTSSEQKTIFENIEKETKELHRPFYVGLLSSSSSSSSNNTTTEDNTIHQQQQNSDETYLRRICALVGAATSSPLHKSFLEERLCLSSSTLTDDNKWLLDSTLPLSITRKFTKIIKAAVLSKAEVSVKNLFTLLHNECFGQQQDKSSSTSESTFVNGLEFFSTLAGRDSSSEEIEEKIIKALVGRIGRKKNDDMDEDSAVLQSNTNDSAIFNALDEAAMKLSNKNMKTLVEESKEKFDQGLIPKNFFESWKSRHEEQEEATLESKNQDAAAATTVSNAAPTAAVLSAPPPAAVPTGFRFGGLLSVPKPVNAAPSTTVNTTALSSSLNNQQQHLLHQEMQQPATIGPRRGPLTMEHIRETLLARLPQSWSEPFDQYPKVGVPFPPLPNDYKFFVDPTNGMYFFKKCPYPGAFVPNRFHPADSSTLHPITQGEYKATPQHFVDRLIQNVDGFLLQNGIPEARFNSWAFNQQKRDLDLDFLVIWELHIRYLPQIKQGKIIASTELGGLLSVDNDEGINNGNKSLERESGKRRSRENENGEVPEEKKEGGFKLPTFLKPEEATKEKKLEDFFLHYPQTGAPFPANDRKISQVSVDKTKGLYVFTLAFEGGKTTTFHPTTRREYRVSPQSVFDEEKLDVKQFCRENSLPILKFREYLADQKVRNEEFDKLILEKFDVQYCI